MRNRNDAAKDVDNNDEHERSSYPASASAAGAHTRSSSIRDGDDAGPVFTGPVTTQLRPQAAHGGQDTSSSSPPPLPSAAVSVSPAVAGVGVGGVPSFISGAPSWLLAHPLMSTLFGDQQQQRRAGEGGGAVATVVTPTATASSSTMATATGKTTSSNNNITSVVEDDIISQQLQLQQHTFNTLLAPLSSSSPEPPTSSLTTPILQDNMHRGRSDDVPDIVDQHKKDCGVIGTDGTNKAPNVITLTRTHFSSPESRSYYHPLHDDDDDEYDYHPDCTHRGPMAGHFASLTAGEDAANSSTFATTTAALTGDSSGDGEGNGTLGNKDVNSDLFLKHTYPLTLQRSASSAFGCPYSSTSSSFCSFKARARVRTLSNSGYSDPGASAFRPVWNKSSSNDIGSDVGSNVGSTISSSVAGAAATTHSDPLSDRTRARAYNSPWRRVMNRMKKGNYNAEKGNIVGGGGRKFKRRLSGRENPNAAGLDVGDDDLDGGGLVGVIASLSELRVDGSLPTVSVDIESKKTSSTKEVNTATLSSPSKSTSNDIGGEVCDVELVHNKGKDFASLVACHSADQYDDPGVALDLSDDSDHDDEETIPPILGSAIHSSEYVAGSKSSGSTIDGVIRPNQKRNTKEEPSPPIFDHAPCDSIEVTTMLVSESILGSVRIISSDSIDEHSPPSVERVVVCENSGNFPYHPLSDSDGEENYETEQGDVFHVEDIQGDTNLQSAGHRQLGRLKYRSPQRAPRPIHPTLSSSRGSSGSTVGQQLSPSSSHDSPESRYSSLGGSPESRMSSSNSRSVSSTLNSSGDRTINTEGSLVADDEVRDANRRPYPGRIGRSASGGGLGGDNNQEVVVGPDGSETVFSSSTASSNYHSYVSSPRTLRDGATMPVERFFAGGNVTMSPSPQRGMGTSTHPDDIRGGEAKEHALPDRNSSAPIISKLLIPKKLSKKSSCGTISSARDSTHSPHTVSSNSVSANSSSSSETKKPLKFVAYEFREERESPFDEPPVSGYDAASTMGAEASSGAPVKTDACMALIKPRISKLGGSHRPPMVQRPSAYIPVKPPQSPRRTTLLHGRARTPTRTPPPSSSSSNARSGSNTPSSPPVIIDGPSNAGMFWIPQHPAVPPRPGIASAALSMSSQLRDDELMITEMSSGADDAVHDNLDSTERSGVEVSAPSTTTTTTMGAIVSPEKSTMQNTMRRLHLIAPKPEKTTHPFGEVPTISPEKGF